MTRSFALSLFFVTFEPWVIGLQQAGLDQQQAFPLGVFLGWLVNLVVAEVVIRRARRILKPELEPEQLYFKAL